MDEDRAVLSEAREADTYLECEAMEAYYAAEIEARECEVP